MSNTPPLTWIQRQMNYFAQNKTQKITPKQLRRLFHKFYKHGR